MKTTSKTWKRIVLALALTLVSALGIGGWLATRAYAHGPWGDNGGYGMMGPGMMGGWGYGGYQGCGDYGMMGPWGGTYPEGTETLTMDEAEAAIERSLEAWNNDDRSAERSRRSLEVAEVMEFSTHFYAIVQEISTGIGAFEVLVDRVTGAVYPEPGPNMMWNLKYGMMSGYGMGMMGGGYGGMMGSGYGYGGMMGGGQGYGGMMGGMTNPAPSSAMPIDEARAIELAQEYLDTVRPGTTADEEADTFYGYYTLHVLTDGEVTGMLSVNGYTGQVWYHTWHGAFVDMTEHD